MARIGADIAGLESTAGVMDETGTEASGAGTEASSVSGRMEGEITDVTTMLTQHFSQLHEQLRGALQRAKGQLDSTDWDGNAFAEAQRAETDLNSQTSRFMESAQQGVEEFRQAMMSQANSFVSAVEGEYRSVMGNINDAYAGFGTAQRTHAGNLQEVDSSFRYNG